MPLIFLLIVAVLFGGGGSGAGLANLAVQLSALLVLALYPQAVIDFFRRAPRVPVVLIGMALVLPLLQSIPLPASVWQSLPGRDAEREVLAFMGRSDAWLPFSLEWRRTLIAFLAMLPPFAMLVLAWRLPEGQRRQMLIVIVGLGAFMVLLGTQQLLGGNRRLMFFDEAFGSRYLLATFAGHSALGLYLDLALCALVGIFPPRPDFRWLAGGAVVAALLVIGVVLTHSRSAMALVAIPLVVAVLRFCGFGYSRGQLPRNRTTGRLIAALLGLAALMAVGVLLGGQNERIQKSLLRFDDLTDTRPLIWQDTLGALLRYWPMGSGIGTFDEVFQLDETLENLTPARAARAHNEYLEVGVESGGLGLVLLGSWLVFLMVRGWQSLRAGGDSLAAAAGLGVIALQSISDFPLRNQTLLCTAGLLLALLVDLPGSAHTAGRLDSKEVD